MGGKDKLNDKEMVATNNDLQGSPSVAVDLPSELSRADDEETIRLKTAAYEELEEGRKKLKRRLSRLKHDMWGLKFAPDQAKKMSSIMLEGHKLIKNPEMLGAFFTVKQIEDEIAKISFAGKSLNEIDRMIEENKKDGK